MSVFFMQRSWCVTSSAPPHMVRRSACQRHNQRVNTFNPVTALVTLESILSVAKFGISHQKFAVRNHDKDHHRGIHTVRLKRSHAPMLARVSEPTPAITLLQKNVTCFKRRTAFPTPCKYAQPRLSRHRGRHKELRVSIQPAIFELPDS